MNKTLPQLHTRLAEARHSLKWAMFAFRSNIRRTIPVLVLQHQTILQLQEEIKGLEYAIELAEEQANKEEYTLDTIEAIKCIGLPVLRRNGRIFIHFTNPVQK